MMIWDTRLNLFTEHSEANLKSGEWVVLVIRALVVTRREA
jgi:hypothetical protein